VDELPPGYFRCQRASCTLSVTACLGRQTANERRKGFEPIPFGVCLQCPQGLENRLRQELDGNQKMQGKPQRGQGARDAECRLYDECLSMAALADWKSWNCDSCPLYQDRKGSKAVKDPKATQPKPPNTRICSDCGERTTLSPNCPYCAHCMNARSRSRDKGKTKKKPEPKPGPEPGQKRATESPNFGRSRSPEGSSTPFSAKTPIGSNGTLLIEFGRYGHEGVLREVEKLAENELRPVNLQVIYLLREQLKSVLTDH
jgi:hypothetical protein